MSKLRLGKSGNIIEPPELICQNGAAHGGLITLNPSILTLFLYFSAAITGAAVLVIEVVGTRLLAPLLGQSHYVWTAQISVTLSGLAAGYALGGRWSRRGHGVGTLYFAVGAAGASLAAAVETAAWVVERTLPLSLGFSTLVTSTTLFFVR